MTTTKQIIFFILPSSLSVILDRFKFAVFLVSDGSLSLSSPSVNFLLGQSKDSKRGSQVKKHRLIEKFPHLLSLFRSPPFFIDGIKKY
jgi:hypothetical protein